MKPQLHNIKRIGSGLLWVGPNLLGFAAFTLFPLLFSLYMAFTNWDLTRHNALMAQQLGEQYEGPRIVGLANFVHLFQSPRFGEYLGNTLFLMLAIPFNIAASLTLAILLSKPMFGKASGTAKHVRIILAGFVGVFGLGVLIMLGLRIEATIILFCTVLTLVLALGMAGGSTLYRTLFYLPHFTAGVAVYILWKRLYSLSGPINTTLAEPLHKATVITNSTPAILFAVAGGLFFIGAAAVLLWSLRAFARTWRDGELGTGALVIANTVACLPVVIAVAWWSGSAYGPLRIMPWLLVAGGAVALSVQIVSLRRRFTGRPVQTFDGFGSVLLSALIRLTIMMVLMGLGAFICQLPLHAAGRDGLQPPDWLNQHTWAKPAIMVMGFWAALGSNNMLLYLAGLSNVPPELYEAADIDGASGLQRFWHVTWPQLAPTTFFIFIMSVIGGLQGGFDAARVLTEGGAGTTTLSYFIYTSAFVDLGLGYGSAIAWVLFALVLVVTLFNWKIGNTYVND